jgi:Domain of unknown function (DUF1707)/Cell wall-active antibiotics response 4TMS YvqF
MSSDGNEHAQPREQAAAPPAAERTAAVPGTERPAGAGGPPAERPLATPDTSPRASDAERNAAIDRLRAAYVDGRIDQDEFDERSQTALTSKTIGQLERLFDDLPSGYGQRAVSAVGQTPAVRPGQPTGNRVSIAIMSGVDRKGPWRVPDSSTAFAMMGGISLDLRDAILSNQVTTITAVAFMGGIEIVVPPGMHVESSGFGCMGAFENNAVINEHLPPDAPVLRVRGCAMMGGVEIKTKERRDRQGRDSIEGRA